MTPDVFGTDALRRAVLEAWRTSPTRLREDANTEEDHAHGSYRGRVVVELAQNAADAAVRAGVAGRLHLTLRRLGPPVPTAAAPSGATSDPAVDGAGESWVLRAANTGAPLDAAGVESLAAMRASATAARPTARADGSPVPVGRFGIGFAALRSVADTVRIGSGDHAVEFSLARTRAALADALSGDDRLVDDDRLADEVRRRGDRLPVLRLPFPAHVDVPAGADTVVEIVLRDDAAVRSVRAELDAVGDALLLALPALAEVVVDDGATPSRRVADVAQRWTVVRRDGELPAELLAERPVEERARRHWSVTWALPHAGTGVATGTAPTGAATDVVHAPTPTDEPSSFPALLLASFPLDPSRRHVAEGPLARHVARLAGDAYADLVVAVAPAGGIDVLGLVPTGLPAGTVDAHVRDAALAALRRAPVLPVAGHATTPTAAPPGDLPDDAPDLAEHRGPALVAPEDALVLAGDVGADVRVCAALGVPNLVAVPRHLVPEARALGVGVLDLADVVDDLPAPDDPSHWGAVYDALAPYAADRGVREALGALPVPLVDGRTARGARGLVVLDVPPDVPLTAHDVAGLGLRVVDPVAAHPLLERLGAARSGPRELVVHDAVRARVLAVAEADEDGEDVADAVASLLALVGAAVGDGLDDVPFWWGELPLRADGGVTGAARSLALPGSWAAAHLDLDVVDRAVVDRWGDAVLRTVGVAVGLGVLRVRDVLMPAPGEEPDLAPHGPEGWLSDWSGYVEHLADLLGPGVFVGDVHAVADLDAVVDGAWPDALAAIAADPSARAALLDRVRVPGGVDAPSYTAWWLREELGGPFAVGDVPFLRGAPAEIAGLDDAVLVALGGVRDLAELLPDDWADLLDALPVVGSRIAGEDAVAWWRALAALARRGQVPDLAPERVPALVRAGAVVADAGRVVVAADAMWAPLRPVVPAPRDLVDDVADLLDVAVAPPAPVPDAAGSPRAVPGPVARVLEDVPARWWWHEDLRVTGEPVPWWVVGSGSEARVHATDAASLAEALAAAAGRPSARHVVEDVLRDPEGADAVVAQSVWRVLDGDGQDA